MKISIGSVTLFILIIIFSFSSCHKDTNPTTICLVSSASISERRVNILYDPSNRPIEFKDYSDTVNDKFITTRFNYGQDGMLSNVRIYDSYGIIDSFSFEYNGSSKIRERHYYWNGTGMIANYQRNFTFNQLAYLSSDTLYAIYSSSSVLTSTEYDNYEYDKNGNVIKIDHFYNSESGFVLDNSVSYEYSEYQTPNSSYNFARFTCLARSERIYEYILPHRANLISKESYSGSVSGNYSFSHSYDINTKKYPVKEYTLQSEYIYSYQCN